MGQASAEIIDLARYRALRVESVVAQQAIPARAMWQLAMIWVPVWMPFYLSALAGHGHFRSNA